MEGQIAGEEKRKKKGGNQIDRKRDCILAAGRCVYDSTSFGQIRAKKKRGKA